MSFPRSMTGFGRGDNEVDNHTWSVEIKSVNHRFCDIKAKIPRQLFALEDRIKKEISQSFSRGHVDVIITSSGTMETGKQLEVDHSLASQYKNCLVELGDHLDLECNPTALLKLVSTPFGSNCSQPSSRPAPAAWKCAFRKEIT